MNLTEILAELRRERALLDEAITSLQRLWEASVKPRRGRPPKWLQARKHRTSGRRNRKRTPRAVAVQAA